MSVTPEISYKTFITQQELGIIGSTTKEEPVIKLTPAQKVEEFLRKNGIISTDQVASDNGQPEQSVSLGHAVLGSTLPPRTYGGIVKAQNNNGNNGHH